MLQMNIIIYLVTGLLALVYETWQFLSTLHSTRYLHHIAWNIAPLFVPAKAPLLHKHRARRTDLLTVAMMGCLGNRTVTASHSVIERSIRYKHKFNTTYTV